MTASPCCFKLFVQLMVLPLSLALFNAGRSIAARMAMMAITMSNSMRVNDLRLLFLQTFGDVFKEASSILICRMVYISLRVFEDFI